MVDIDVLCSVRFTHGRLADLIKSLQALSERFDMIENKDLKEWCETFAVNDVNDMWMTLKKKEKFFFDVFEAVKTFKGDDKKTWRIQKKL